MPITTLVVEDVDAAPLGLAPFTLKKLSKIVVFAGPNGSGKSRLLRYVDQSLRLRHEISTPRKTLDEQIILYRTHIQEHPENRDIPQLRTTLADFERSNRLLDNIEVTSSDRYTFAPIPQLVDSWTQSRDAIESGKTLAETLTNNNSSTYAMAYVQSVHDQYWHATHQDSEATDQERAEARGKFESLLAIIKLFVGVSPQFSKLERRPLLFGKPIALAALSNGQLILLQMAVDLHAKQRRLESAVVFLDEPELHLHPSAVIEFIDRIAASGANTQLWISTHCVPLLAHLHARGDASLYYMKAGKPEFAGSAPQEVLQSLLGDDARASELREYIGFSDRLALTNYAAQCLLPPTSVEASSRDDQVNQIAKFIASKAGPLKILDFGAGKGRLLTSLQADAAEVLANAQLYALETNPESFTSCKNAYAMAGHPDRAFGSTDSLLEKVDDKSIDLVVLCNVLHEIDPDAWLELFAASTGIIQRLLKDDGEVLLVEDMAIPRGEHAHKYGFMVLDTAQIRTLFSITSHDSGEFVTDIKRNDRLKAHLISKSLLSRISRDTRDRAIEQLRTQARTKIEEIRSSSNHSFGSGRLHAFWLAQFANASLWMAKHGNE